MKSKRQQNIDDKRISAAYHARCNGIQVSVMDLGKIYKAGQGAIDAGANDAALGDAVAAFVDTIRKN